MAEVTRMAMHGTMIAMEEERRRAPTTHAELELQWVANDVLNILDHDTMLQYVIMAPDAYFRLHDRCSP